MAEFDIIGTKSESVEVGEYPVERDPGLYDGLDPDIRREVLCLRAHGVETFQSCQGGNGHCFPKPTVQFHGTPAEGPRAFAIARMYGLEVSSLRRVWTVRDGELTGPHWEMTFRRQGRAPRFVEANDGSHFWDWS